MTASRHERCDGAGGPPSDDLAVIRRCALAPTQAPKIMPALFTSEQAAAYMGFSEAKFHELRDEPWMAASIALSVRMVRWSRADLDAAIAAMPRQARRSAKPARLLRTRIERAKSTGSLR